MRLVLLLLGLSSFDAWADDKRQGILEYKYREGVMNAIEGHMDAITSITRGRIHQENLAFHARSLADLARIVPTVFPANSNIDRSEALPDVWTSPDDFGAAVERFIEASAALSLAVEDKGDVRKAVVDVARACDGCHDDFRE